MGDKRIEDQAVATLIALSRGRWSRVATEWQEDEGEEGSGECHPLLLLTVSAPEFGEGEITWEWRQEIYEALLKVIPAHASQEPMGSWMVIFEKEGKVFDSVFPGADRPLSV